jgi:hypothetical protein
MIDWFRRDVTPDEDQQIAAFMTRLAAAPLDAAPRLADVDVLRVKAQLLRRWNAERKVQASLDVMEPMQILAGLAAAALLLVWAIPSLLELLADLPV